MKIKTTLSALLSGSLLAMALGGIAQVTPANPVIVGLNATGGTPQDTPEVEQTTFFFSLSGDDANDCTQEEPCETVAKANSLVLEAGDTVYFTGGETFPTTELTFASTEDGASGNPITVTSAGIGRATLLGANFAGDWWVSTNINYDHNGGTTPNIQITGDSGVLEFFECYDVQHDCVEIDGAAGTTTIKDGEIYYALRGTLASNDDAHAISCRPDDDESMTVVILRMELHHVSGDGVQCDPDRASNSTVTFDVQELECWTGPLEINYTTAGGQWNIGESPGENCLDTKGDVLAGSVLNGTWSQLECYGFSDIAEIANRSCFNIKENAVITIDRANIHDNEIAIRYRGAELSVNCGDLSGTQSCGDPELTVINALLYNNIHAFNTNSSVAAQDLTVYNSVFANNTNNFTEVSAGNNAATSDLRNNLFFTTLPSDFTDSSNINLPTDEVVDYANDDYRLTECATTAIDAGDTIGAVTVDYTGVARSGTNDVGAYDGFVAWECESDPGPPSDHSYFEDISSTPTHGTSHLSIPFRSEADIATWDAGQGPNNPGHASFYDAGEDAVCWDFLGTGSNRASTFNGFRGAFTPITSGRALFYIEVKFIGPWLEDIDGATTVDGNGNQLKLRVWKDQHIKLNNIESVDRELRFRFDIAPRAGTNVALIDLRTYGNTPPLGEYTLSSGAITTEFIIQEEKWARIWRYEDIDTNQMTWWIGDEDRAPVKIMNALQFSDIPQWGGFTIQHITSQEGANSGPQDVKHCIRNFAMIRGLSSVAQAQTLVNEGDQTQ